MAVGVISSRCICLSSAHAEHQMFVKGGNVISRVIPANLDYSHNDVAYFLRAEKKMGNLLVERDIGKILIIDLRGITNCLFEMLFHGAKSVKD